MDSVVPSKRFYMVFLESGRKKHAIARVVGFDEESRVELVPSIFDGDNDDRGPKNISNIYLNLHGLFYVFKLLRRGI